MRAAVIGGLLCLSVPLPAMAGRCTVENGALAFGGVEASPGGQRTAIGELVLACIGGGEVLVTVSLQDEGATGQRMQTRLRRDPAFALYLDPAHRQAWGDGQAGGQPMRRRMQANGHPLRIPVYGTLWVAGSTAAGGFRRDLSLELVVEAADAGP